MTAQYRVIDSIMGSGKTTKIIQELREADSKQDRFLVITPYLDEVDRFTNEVPELSFKKTKDSEKSNLAMLHELLEARENIASTHALFTRWNEKTLDLIKKNNYQLIIDEAVNCLREYGSQEGELSSNDIMVLVDSGLIKIAEDSSLVWNGERALRYDSAFAKLKEDCDSGRLFRMGDDDHTDGMMFWEFPIEILNAFQQVTVLTYLFYGSLMSVYLEGKGVEPALMSIDGNRNLVDWSEDVEAEAIRPVAELINLLEDEKLNQMGDSKVAFASGWISNRSDKTLKQISNDAKNALQNRFKAKADTAMWSCVLRFKDSLVPTGYKKSFIECNKRATNEFRGRKHLAYLRNVYMTPTLHNFCLNLRDAEPDNDAYALAELLQWVFRSAIRDGQPINLYLPSARMRKLLKNWMSSSD